MADDEMSVAAAVLATEFIRRGELDDAEAVRLWRRIRKRMVTAMARENGAHLGGATVAAAAASLRTVDDKSTRLRRRRVA